MNGYSHILWDWNGTLLDDVGLCVDIINAMLARRGRPGIVPRRYKSIFDFPVRGYYERAGFDFSKETFESACTEFCKEYAARVGECSLHDNAQSVLEACAADGFHQIVLSTMEQSTLEAMVARFGITRLFASVVGQADHYAVGKAARAQELLASLGICADRALLIGDTTHDAEVAREIGVDCVLVAAGHHSHEKLLQTHARVVEQLASIMPILAEPCAAAEHGPATAQDHGTQLTNCQCDHTQ
jgi:phosphoglycolate phosphatase